MWALILRIARMAGHAHGTHKATGRVTGIRYGDVALQERVHADRLDTQDVTTTQPSDGTTGAHQRGLQTVPTCRVGHGLRLLGSRPSLSRPRNLEDPIVLQSANQLFAASRQCAYVRASGKQGERAPAWYSHGLARRCR